LQDQDTCDLVEGERTCIAGDVGDVDEGGTYEEGVGGTWWHVGKYLHWLGWITQENCTIQRGIEYLHEDWIVRV